MRTSDESYIEKVIAKSGIGKRNADKLRKADRELRGEPAPKPRAPRQRGHGAAGEDRSPLLEL